MSKQQREALLEQLKKEEMDLVAAFSAALRAINDERQKLFQGEK